MSVCPAKARPVPTIPPAMMARIREYAVAHDMQMKDVLASALETGLQILEGGHNHDDGS